MSCFSLSQILLAALILYLICLPIFFRKKGLRKNLALAFLFLYSGFVFSLTVPVIPPKFWNITSASTEWAVRSICWEPLHMAPRLFRHAQASGDWTEFLWQTVGNFLLLVPFGILVSAISENFRFWKSFVLSLLVPVGIESLQLVSNILYGSVIRTVDLEDVVLNASGCLIACLIVGGIRRLHRPRRRAKHYR